MAALLSSCENASNYLVLIYNDGDGISVGDPVTMNSNSVGEVSSVEITKDYKVKVTVQFKDSLPPVGSQFYIRKTGIQGERNIEVIPSNSRFTMRSGDTVLGSQMPQNTSPTANISKLLKKISLLLSQEENDSLLLEISSLKRKVDSLESVRNNLDSTRNSLNDSSLRSNET